MLFFIKQLILNPKNTGALAASSSHLTNLMIHNAQLDTAHTVVELGPGNGSFTKRIVSSLHPGAIFFCIELNQNFVNQLKLNYPDVHVYSDSAEKIDLYLKKHNKSSCDRVLSGLPWTHFEDELQDRLLDSILSSLEDGGLFLTFTYFSSPHMPGGRRFARKLRQRFSSVRKTQITWLNVLPAFVYVCKK